MSKIIVGVNTLTEVEASAYSNHCQFWFRQGRNTSHDFILNHPRRMSIDRMRNITAKIALDTNSDYVCFIDDDVLVPLDTIDRLIECDADIAAGHTLIRGYPFQNMFFRWTDDTKLNLANVKDKDISYDSRGDIPVDAVGFSCVLIKTSFLKQIDSPYFVTGPFNTEDIYFCVKGKQKFPNCKYVVNPRVITSHNLGPEYLSSDNVDAYRKYFEETNIEVIKPKEEKEGDVAKNVAESVDFNSGPTIEELLNESVFNVPLPIHLNVKEGDPVLL